MGFRKRLLWGATFASASSLWLVPSALAQSVDSRIETGRTLDEIVVTAQRREEQIQDVPLAVSAFDGSAIESLNARDIRDLASVVPNLVISKVAIGPSMTQVSLRGVNSQDPEKSFDPAVGVFIDGVYLGTSAFNLLDTFDLERVEVLRGPQGTLFGRNTTGGAINAIRSSPTGKFGIKAKVTVGNSERLDAAAVVNAPIVEDLLALKFAAFVNTDGGQWKNPSGGATGAEDRWSTSTRLRWTPNTDLTIDFTWDHAEDDSELTPYIPLGVAAATTLPYRITGVPPTPATILAASPPDRFCTIAGGRCRQTDFSFSNVTDPHRMDAKLDAYTLNGDWKLGESWTLTGVLGYREAAENVYIDFDGSNLTVFNVVRSQDYDQWSAEFRVASNFDGPLNFVAGAFHFNSRYALRQAIKLDVAMVSPVPALGLAYANASGDEDNHRAKTTAIFAQTDWSFAPDWTLTLGGRVSWDDKRIRTKFVGSPVGMPPTRAAYSVSQGVPANRPVTSSGGASESWTEFTPRVSLKWRINDDLQAYASYTRGYNAGGFSGRAGTVLDVTTPFNPEHINSFEAGFKSDLLDRRARLNVAVFYNDYEDKQEEAIQPGPPPTFTSTTVRNVAGARIMGIELEGTAILSDNLRIETSAGFMNAEYTDYKGFVSTAQYISTPPQPAGTLLRADLSSLKLRRVPEMTASFTPTWEAPLADGFLTARATARYVSEQYAEFFNDPRGRIPGQTFLDASISYRWGGKDNDRMSLTLFGENLTDEQDTTSFTNSIVDFGTVASPRLYGLTLQVNY